MSGIREFLANRDRGSDDIVIHYELLRLLAMHHGLDLASYFTSYLRDNWGMKGAKNEGFPLRYAGAWGFFFACLELKKLPANIAMDELVWGSSHEDPRLATPLLMVVGAFANKIPQAHLDAIVSSASFSPSRAALMCIASATMEDKPNESILRVLGPDHPVQVVIALAEKKLVTSSDDWERKLESDASLNYWIGSLKHGTNAEWAILYSIDALFDNKLDLAIDLLDVQSQDLATPVGTLTMFGMSGGI